MARNGLHLLSMAETPHRNERCRTILVVEDEAAIRNVLRFVLRRMGHTVLEAGDGAEGLTISRNFNGRIDLFISDVRMPKMDGPAMARHLQTERPGIKALFISAYSTQSLSPDLTERFLHKPFLPSAIEEKVRELLKTSES